MWSPLLGRGLLAGCVGAVVACEARRAPTPQPVKPPSAGGSKAGPERQPKPAATLTLEEATALGPDHPDYRPSMTTGRELDEPHPETRDLQYDIREDEHLPPLLKGIAYVESPPGGDPSVVGCADGQREGFADIEKYPTIAGCIGDWSPPNPDWGGVMADLRMRPTGRPCGDDLGECSYPADTCAKGWHVCGALSKGEHEAHELTSRIGPDDCDNAGPGRFNAGFSHAHGAYELECDYPEPGWGSFGCWNEGFGSEPVCCGSQCEFGRCRDAVWPGRTRISRGVAEGCGHISATRNGGVLCCADTSG